MEQAGISVLRTNECEVVDLDWGELRWHASGSLGNSGEMTLGTARLKPGQANPRHYHPNCSEVLVVVSGGISHTLDAGETAELGPGDTVTIPEGVPHKARNLSETEEAVLFIAFSSADRQTVMEE
ncbi:MAG: cupin domain-containing protein [Gemmatimonadetes bacterium]|nr:cupin domain-containing protein [Gemmatimonadota bacterium]